MVSGVSFHYQNGKLRHPKAGSQLHDFATLQTSEGGHKIEWGCKKQCHSFGPSTACLCWDALLSLVTVSVRESKVQMCPVPALPSHLQRKSLLIKFEKHCGACKKKCAGTHFFEIADILEDERSFKSPALQPHRH